MIVWLGVGALGQRPPPVGPALPAHVDIPDAPLPLAMAVTPTPPLPRIGCPPIAAAADEAIEVPVPHIDRIRGVATSPSAPGVIAAWSKRRAWLSRDDGRTWREVLKRRREISSMAVDCHGDVWVLRDWAALGHLDRDGQEHWQHVPVAPPFWSTDDLDEDDEHPRPGAIVSGGGALAVVVLGSFERSIAISTDRGASWVVRDHTTDPHERSYLWIDHDARWRATLIWNDCETGGQYVLSGPARRPRRRDIEYAGGTAIPGHDGWAYTTRDQDGTCSSNICALAPGAKQWRSIDDGSHDNADWVYGVIGEGRTVLSIDDDLYAAARGRIWRLGVGLRGDSTLAGVDSAGRIYAITSDGVLTRWSARHGWRPIL